MAIGKFTRSDSEHLATALIEIVCVAETTEVVDKCFMALEFVLIKISWF